MLDTGQCARMTKPSRRVMPRQADADPPSPHAESEYDLHDSEAISGF